MKHYCLDITLLDDVVFSVRPATQGDHECLDRVPGTALWGWAAAWLHRHHPQHAVPLAHEGRLQFSDARPLSPSSAPSWPTPLVWAADKGSTKPHVLEGQLQGSALMNLSHPQADPAKFAQAKGLRGGYVSAHGELSHPQTRFRLKTALDPSSGTVASGQLFGYDSLQADQQFQARLGVAADADPAVVQALLSALGHARLGRSRSGEYGRVQVSVKPTEALPAPALQGERLTLWLLSDALLRDTHGRPCVAPDHNALGLPGACFMPEYSALRQRSYSPWNAHRNTYGVERQVLVAGSVLVFERPGQPFTHDELQRLQAGLGTERHHGLGEMYVNPPLLQAVQPVFSARPTAPAAKPADPACAAGTATGTTPLMAFLQRRISFAEAGHAEALESQWIGKVAAHLRSSRRYQGTPLAQPLGPSASQWGRLASELQGCNRWEDLDSKVFRNVLDIADEGAPASAQGRSGVHQSLRTSEDWNVRASGDRKDTLGICLKGLLQACLKDAQGLQWRAFLRSAVHACNEIRRMDLHLQAKLQKLQTATVPRTSA